jgi:hypothetical protein
MDGRKSIRERRGEEVKCQFSYFDGVVVSVRSQYVVFVFYCRFACYETFGMNAWRLCNNFLTLGFGCEQEEV